MKPLTRKEKRKLRILVNRVKGHTENIIRSAVEIDNLLPSLINSGKKVILKLSMESQSDSYNVWALEKIMKQWDKTSTVAMHGKSKKRKWMKIRKRRIKRMRDRIPKFKYHVTKRNRRAVEDVDIIYDEILNLLTDIIKRLDNMWMKLFEFFIKKDGKCDQNGAEGSGKDDTELECEVEGSGKMDITDSESEAITSISRAGSNDNDDDFEFTDVKRVVMSTHREHFQSIIDSISSESKSLHKMSKNLAQDVEDIKLLMDEVKAKKLKVQSDVNKSAKVVSIYRGLVTNATNMRHLLNETEQRIKIIQMKCSAAQKLAEHVLADKDELHRLLEKKKKEKKRKDKKKKKRKKLHDKSNDNAIDFERREKKRKDKKRKEREKVETDISKKLLEENEKTKTELKELIEKYLRLQKEDEERKNEENRKKKKTENIEVEDTKERKKNRRKKIDFVKKNKLRKGILDSLKEEKKRKKKENVDDQMKKRLNKENDNRRKSRNKTGKRRKEELNLEKGEEINVKEKKKKKLTNDRKNAQDINKLTEKANRREREDKNGGIDSVLAIKANLEDVLKKLNQRLDRSKKWNQRQQKKRKRRRKNISSTSKKRNEKQFMDAVVLVDKKNNKELNEKEETKDENEENRKKRRKKEKYEVKNPKVDVNENNRTKEMKKKHKKDKGGKKQTEKVENFKEDMMNNSGEKKERKKIGNEEKKNRKRKKTNRTAVTNKEYSEKEKKKIENRKKKMSLEERRKVSSEESENEAQNVQEKTPSKIKTRKEDIDQTGFVEDNLKNREKTNEKIKEKKRKKDKHERKSKDRENNRKESKNKGEEEKREKKKSDNDRYRKNINETEAKSEIKKKDRIIKQRRKKKDLTTKKKEKLKERTKSDNILAELKMDLFEKRKVTKNKKRRRQVHRKRKEILSGTFQYQPIFIQNEEENFAEKMKNQTEQIEKDVHKSKTAVESLVKQLKQFSPDPCTTMTENIQKLRFNASQIRQQIQLARTIVASMKIPVSLNGKEHLEVMLDQKVESREIQTSAEICIKPRSSDSIILSLQTNNSISYTLSLVDSKPLLTILDADGEVLQNLETDMELIQDNWYRLLMNRIGQNFSLSVNARGSKAKRITVQKFIPDFSPQQIPLSLASLGGYPQDFPISNFEKLKGCIASLNINGRSTHIFSPFKNGLSPPVCKTVCEPSTNTSIIFEGNGFALLEVDDIFFKKTFTSVQLTFKTFQKNALLMAIKKNSEILFLLILIEGNIQVESKVQSLMVAKQSQGIQFSDGQPHTIQVTVIKKRLKIKTSIGEVEFEDKNASDDEKLFDEGISLGGLVSNPHNESNYRSFTGCLSNVSIDDKQLNLLYLKDGRHVYQGNCQKNIWLSCAHFTESSVPVSLAKYDHVRAISLMVSSQAQGVALFFQRDSKFSIRVELTMTEFKVFNYEDDKGKTIPKNYTSGFWHILQIEDQKGNIRITIDGEQSVDIAYKEDTAGWFASNADDFSMFVTVGGLPKDHDSFKKTDTFIGSISTFFIQHFLFNLNQEFGNSNNLLVCAKPAVESFTNKFHCTESISR